MKDHLNTHRWTVAPRTMEIIRQIVAPSKFAEPLRNLFLEGRAIELVGETLAAMMSGERVGERTGPLTSKDVARLNRAKEFIATNLDSVMTVETIAREAGLNPSGLQQVFRTSEGVSIFEYVRNKRLELALSQLRSGMTTVAEASSVAGYSSPTNFAKAFKRAFGVSPREAVGYSTAHRQSRT